MLHAILNWLTDPKLVENVEAFDVGKVRYEDIQRSAIMAAPSAG